VKDWGKVAPVRTRPVGKPPEGVKAGDTKLLKLGHVRLGKVYLLSSNYKDCHNVLVFSQGPLKLTCAHDLY